MTEEVSTNIGNDNVGASAEAHAEAGTEVTDSSVSADAEVGASAEAHAGTTVGGVDMEVMIPKRLQEKLQPMLKK